MPVSYTHLDVYKRQSQTNVTLIGISGGVSYGALGMTHHSCQDIAAMASLPGMRVYLPSDRFQTEWLVKELLQDELPSYIRVSRSPSEDVYKEGETFGLNEARVLAPVSYTHLDVYKRQILAAGTMMFTSGYTSYAAEGEEPIAIADQGIFSAGGITLTSCLLYTSRCV